MINESEQFGIYDDDVFIDGDIQRTYVVPPTPSPPPDLDGLTPSTNDLGDDDLIVSKENGGSAWVKKTAVKLWNYVKTKLGISAQGSTGKYLDEQGNFTIPPNTTYESKAAVSGGTDESLVTTGEKYVWNNKMSASGDSKANTTTFTSSDTTDANATSWTSVTTLASGETHASIFAKMSKMFKNIRYLRNAVTYDHANIVVIPIANINGYVAPRKGKLLVSLPNRNTDDSHYFAIYVNNATNWAYAIWVAPKSRTNFSIDLEKNDVITLSGQSLSTFNIGASDNPFQFLPTKTI